MANRTWKRIEKSPAYQKKKLFFKRLAGRELRHRPDTGVATVKAGGWWFHPTGISDRSVVYSLGVGDDIEFDVELIRRFGASVHAFDPTPSSMEWISDQDLPGAFHFHPWAVAREDGSLTLYPRIRHDGTASSVMYTTVGGESADAISVPAYSISTIAQRLGHARIDLMKMDVEGAEYEVLESMLESRVRPRQLLIEFHHRLPGIGQQRTLDAVARLRNAGYGLFAVSETGRELSFLYMPSLDQ